MTRDYSEVQKGKDICDRVCGVAKARMRSWASSGNDILNANDIKEGMEYAGGVKNTKIGVAEIMSGAGKYSAEKQKPFTHHLPLSLKVTWARQMCLMYRQFVLFNTIHST